MRTALKHKAGEGNGVTNARVDVAALLLGKGDNRGKLQAAIFELKTLADESQEAEADLARHQALLHQAHKRLPAATAAVEAAKAERVDDVYESAVAGLGLPDSAQLRKARLAEQAAKDDIEACEVALVAAKAKVQEAQQREDACRRLIEVEADAVLTAELPRLVEEAERAHAALMRVLPGLQFVMKLVPWHEQNREAIRDGRASDAVVRADRLRLACESGFFDMSGTPTYQQWVKARESLRSSADTELPGQED